MKSPIRWAGSKRQVLHRLRPYWPGGATRYVEPFAGSASLFFDLQPHEAVLGDLNPELIWAYRALQKDVGRVIESLRRLPVGRDAYYRIRAVKPETLAEADLAARFLYLNHYCFNGLYRTNTRGDFNVPYGPPKSGSQLDEDLLTRAAAVLQRAVLLDADFDVTARRASPRDFVYLDPPYAVSRRRVFAQYIPGSFATADLQRLADLLAWLDRRNVAFVVTYADSREARALLSAWHPLRVWSRRNVAGFVHDRRGTYELLATNLTAREQT